LIDQVARALDELSRREHWSSDEDLVFVNPVGSYVEASALRRRFYSARDSAGLEPIRFHDLRHTFGTIAVQAFPLTDVKTFTGHADIQATMIYIRHVPQRGRGREAVSPRRNVHPGARVGCTVGAR
jgi:integrase